MSDAERTSGRFRVLDRVNDALSGVLERQWENLKSFGRIAADYIELIIVACVQLALYLGPSIFFVCMLCVGIEITTRAGYNTFLIAGVMYTVGIALVLFSGWFLVGLATALLPGRTGQSRDTASGDKRDSDVHFTSHVIFLCVDFALLIALYALTVGFPHRFSSLPLQRMQMTLVAALTVGPDLIPAEVSDHLITLSSKPVWNANGQRLSLWVESASLANDRTVLNLAAKAWGTDDAGYLVPAGSAYLIDNNGKRYLLLEDGGRYLRTFTNAFFFHPQQDVEGQEVSRFSLAFAPIPIGTKYITLHHPEFYECRIDLGDVAASLTPHAALEGAPEGTQPVPEDRRDQKPEPSSSVSAIGETPPNERVIAPTQSISILQSVFRDPHICEKPADVYYAQYGPAQPQPAGSGGFANPEFLFDANHQDEKINWANGFTGTVPVCFIVDERGNASDIRFVQSPGEDLERHVTERISGWRYRPALLKQNWLDNHPNPIRVQMAFDFVFK